MKLIDSKDEQVAGRRQALWRALGPAVRVGERQRDLTVERRSPAHGVATID